MDFSRTKKDIEEKFETGRFKDVTKSREKMICCTHGDMTYRFKKTER